MMRAGKLVLVVGLVILAAGCQRFSRSPNYAAPLPATPTTPVDSGALTPLDPNAPGAGVTDPSAQPTDLASNPVAAPTGAKEGRTDGSSGRLEAVFRWRCLHGVHDADHVVRRLPGKYQRL